MKKGIFVLLTLAAAGCGEGVIPAAGDASAQFCPPPTDAAARADGRVVGGPYATRVVSFTPGPGANYGQDELPDIVLGPPLGGGDLRGSTDVVSLGAGGEIVLAFDDVAITDGPGTDFVVFENPFMVPGATVRYWEELGEVSVSDDGVRWVTFTCAHATRPHTGCAGWNVVYASPANAYCPNDPESAGGDGFDLADVGLREARYVRIRDLETQGQASPSTGFDLDAVSVVHGRTLR